MKIRELAINTEVELGGMIWLVRGDNDDKKTITLVLKESLKNMEFDNAEPDSPDENVRDYGNNIYELSNIRQWLNSRGKGWYQKKHMYDAAPSYVGKKGFMSRFSKKELKAIIPAAVGHNDGLCDYFYLPSQDEKSLVTNDQFDENWVWTRSPHSAYSYGVRSVYSTGTLNSGVACAGYYGVRPLCNLASKTKLTLVDDVWRIAGKHDGEEVPGETPLVSVKTVTATTSELSRFDAELSELLSAGWGPLGSVRTSGVEGFPDEHYATLVKREASDEV